MAKQKIAAIIQARMGSERLPGKVLTDIEGKPMLWHVIDRLRCSKKLDDIIIALPDTPKNDVLKDFSEENRVKYFRGSEKDVLGRYYGAAKKFKVDVIVRITADCPLIDPKIVDEVIAKHLDLKADYTSNVLERTFPRGLDAEVFNFKILEAALKESKEFYQKEHVTPYIWERPSRFKLENLKALKEIAYPELRLTVDTQEDLDLIRKIYEYLYNPPNIFYITEIISLLHKKPELIEFNRLVRQKIV